MTICAHGLNAEKGSFFCKLNRETQGEGGTLGFSGGYYIQIKWFVNIHFIDEITEERNATTRKKTHILHESASAGMLRVSSAQASTNTEAHPMAASSWDGLVNMSVLS